jgi:RNA polymerase sigma factor (sigma-70 family)
MERRAERRAYAWIILAFARIDRSIGSDPWRHWPCAMLRFMQVTASQELDTLLRAFLQEPIEAESNHLLEKLLCEHAQPLVKQIIWAKLRLYPRRADDHRELQDSEDISHEVTLQLLKRLREFKANRAVEEFSDFRGYVAVIAYNACYRYLRQKYPERYRLKSKLRYILTHQKGFALWESDHQEWLCGLSVWRHQKKSFTIKEPLRQLRDSPQVMELARLSQKNPQPNSVVHLLAAIFNWLGKPIELEELVNIVAGLNEIKEPIAPADSEGENLVDPREDDAGLLARLAIRQEQHMYLRRLWAEICDLPLEQRTALLLSLRNKQGDDMITLLADVRVASLRQIAEALAIPAEALAQLWNALPLDDATIAIRLGVTRQQVINLRQSARRRLLRRARAFGVGQSGFGA